MNRRPPPEKIPRWSGLDQRHSSCLWFQILGVETGSFLPEVQGDRRNLARQRQTGHLWTDALGQQGSIELLKRTRLVGSDDGRTLEQIFQIVIMIGVEPANRDLFVRPVELSFYVTIVHRCCGSRYQNR